jgi:CheY-like chemotaxis protein
MPVINGIEAAKAIRASSHPDAKSIPIIALSANTYAEDVEQSLAAGMNAHLAKPIDLVELADTLHTYIH